MKAITICQPYAELILLGEKRVENRTWPTSHRGWIGIHAGKSKAWLKTYSPLPGLIDFGALVGYAKLAECLSIRALQRVPRTLNKFSPHAIGPYCWILKDVRRFVNPIAFRGSQGLFEIDDIYLDENLFPTVLAGPRCRVCGCTEQTACDGGCRWVEPDLCSACVPIEDRRFKLETFP